MIKNRNVANDAAIEAHKLNLGDATGIKKFYLGTDGTQAYELAITRVDRAQIFTTLAAAVAAMVASRGDELNVLPGHAETITAAVTPKAGTSIICHGNGDLRPKFTINAAVPGLNFTADDVKWYGGIILSGSSATAATRLIRIAASDFEMIKTRFELPYDVYHAVVIISGDNIKFLDIEGINAVTTSASVHPQTGILNIGGTNVLVKDSYFNDIAAKKAERWRAVIEGGKLTASLVVENCKFLCRGIATRTRTAGASGIMASLFNRAVSPSSNTSAGGLFVPTFQYCIESYDVAAVNVVGTVTVTT